MPFHGASPQVRDLGKAAAYSYLRSYAYMGGSVYYDPGTPGQGALIPGAKIALRLGRVATSEDPQGNPTITDLRDEARFGLMAVDQVSESAVTVAVNLYGSRGELSGSRVVTLGLEASADLDGDGNPDLRYRKPTRAREGLEQAVYLDFVSSEEAGVTSMFCVIPDQYPGGDYPNGVMGINPSGRFIVSKYTKSAQRSLIRGSRRGDYVLDNQSGHYQRMIGEGTASQARALDESELQDMTVSASRTYLYQAADFETLASAQALWSALPAGVTGGDLEPAEGLDTFVVRLNSLLSSPALVENLFAAGSLEVSDSEMAQARATLATLTEDQIVAVNRRIVDQAFPQVSPACLVSEDPVSEIFPLLFCQIVNPDLEDPSLPAPDRSLNVDSGLVRAASNAEQDSNRASIVKTWKKYRSFLKFDVYKDGYLNPKVPGFGFNWQDCVDSMKTLNDIGSGAASAAQGAGWLAAKAADYVVGLIPRSPGQDKFAVVSAENAKKLNTMDAEEVKQVGTGLWKSFDYTEAGLTEAKNWLSWSERVPTGQVFDPKSWSMPKPENVDPVHNLQFDFGLFGYYSVAFGRVEAGVAAAVFLDVDTNLTVSSSLENQYSKTDDGGVNHVHEGSPIVLFNTPGPEVIFPELKTMSAPLGILSLAFGVSGKIGIPIKVTVSGTFTNGLRAAFTGLWGAEAYIAINYTCKYVNIFGLKIPYAIKAWHWDNDVHPVNMASYYLGPSDWLLVHATPFLERASVVATVTPTVYLTPKVWMNDIVYLAAMFGAGEEFKLGLETVNVDGRVVPRLNCWAEMNHELGIWAQAGIGFDLWGFKKEFHTPMLQLVNWKSEEPFWASNLFGDHIKN